MIFQGDPTHRAWRVHPLSRSRLGLHPHLEQLSQQHLPQLTGERLRLTVTAYVSLGPLHWCSAEQAFEPASACLYILMASCPPLIPSWPPQVPGSQSTTVG